MPNVRYLRLRFDQPIYAYDIPRFRAAVIEKTERQVSTFHNHTSDKSYIYRYPLIQYKVTRKKASIVCLNTGTDDIHHLLQHRDMQLRIGERTHNFGIEDVQLNYHRVQIWDTLFEYSLLNWLALNQKHHLRFQELEGDDAAQVDLLQSILTGNILAFAKGIHWQVEQRIQTEITRIKSIKPLPFKGQDLLAFNINFKTNVSLPDYVGLGKGSSVGFGVVKKMQEPTKY